MKSTKQAKKPTTTKKRLATKRLEPIKTSGQGKNMAETPKVIHPTGAPQKQVKAGESLPFEEARKATQFKPGVSPNPGGKPVGARNRLQGDFMRELADDFSEHGKTAIQACRTEKPDVYVKVVASLMPKELAITRPLDDLTDDELDNAVALLRERLGASSSAGKGTKATQGGKATVAVPAVH